MSENAKKVEEKDLKKEAENFLQTLTLGETATVVGLYGELGAGKTTFTKALAQVLGVTQTVTSPTFVLEKIYKLSGQNTGQNTGQKSNKNFRHLIHIDTYRLEGSHELKQLGWDTIVADPQNLIIVEWAEKVEDLLPKDVKKIYFKVIGESSNNTARDISYI